MSKAPLMPMATAVWLVENTSLTFLQIANFCKLHEVEVQGIADGEVAKGIVGYNPIISGQLTKEEINLSSNDQNRPLNITDKEIAYKRNEILKELDQNTLISFLSDKESHRITVFTDVDCGYCRKLHDQIGEYNKLGISIDYAAYPRSGIGTNAFTKMVSAWCSVNPHKALTDLKKGKEINVKFCENQPIAKHYTIGKKIGISGTPAIITSSGELLPGYISPDELYKRLRG